MPDPEHVKIVKQGAKALAAWHADNRESRLDLRGANLSGANLSRANLSRANLREADLSGADPHEANLSRADLSEANLREANLIRANLTWANLGGANLTWANLGGANLRGANLSEADLNGADLNGANLSGANLIRANLSGAFLYWVNLSKAKLDDACVENAIMGYTILADVDLSKVKGLESVRHEFPSSIGVDTLYKSQGKIPEEFLRGCGLPEDFITYLPSLIGTVQPIQYQSCFISYSSKDDEFARRLHARMRAEKLRVWFAPEDMQGGKKIMEQIDQAIQVNDRLLLVLSDQSMKSEWVKNEIRRARKTELREKRQKLFPIRLVSLARLNKWQCLATDPDEDLAAEIRTYHIPDFSNWKDHDAFEAAFAVLLRDLRDQA